MQIIECPQKGLHKTSLQAIMRRKSWCTNGITQSVLLAGLNASINPDKHGSTTSLSPLEGVQGGCIMTWTS